jgi:hypothetical protein
MEKFKKKIKNKFGLSNEIKLKVIAEKLQEIK